MEKISKKTKIIALIAIVLIIAGIIITATVGLNFDLRYQETKRVQLYIGKNFEINDIKQITDEILTNQDVVIQKVEVFEDTVSITAEDITEGQKTNIVSKVNEKYETELVADNIEITSIPHTKGRDIIKPYITPFVTVTIIILAYMAIKYNKLGVIKTILKTSLMLISSQAILLSVIAIMRIPVGRITIPMVLVVYVLSLLGITSKLEKDLNKK